MNSISANYIAKSNSEIAKPTIAKQVVRPVHLKCTIRQNGFGVSMSDSEIDKTTASASTPKSLSVGKTQAGEEFLPSFVGSIQILADDLEVASAEIADAFKTAIESSAKKLR